MTEEPPSKRTIIVTCVCAIIEILLFAGPIYGWASIVPVLTKEGYFAGLCEHTMQELASNETLNDYHCIKREKSLNLVFTVAVSSLTFVQFPFGAMADRLPVGRVRSIGGLVFTFSGVLWIASVSDLKYVVIFAAALLNISGFLLYLPLIQLMNRVLVRNKNLMFSLVSGAYDSSAIVFSIIKIIYDSGISLKHIFIVYTVFGALTTGILTFVTRRLCTSSTNGTNSARADDQSLVEREAMSISSGELGTNGHQKRETLITEEHENLTLSKIKSSTKATRQVGQRKCHCCTGERSLCSLMLSSNFLYQLMFLCMTNLRLVSYIGHLNTALMTRLHCTLSTVNKYLTIFGVIQLLGLPLALIIGPMMDGKFVRRYRDVADKRKYGCLYGLLLTNVVQVLLNVFAVTPVLEIQVLTFFCHVTLRAFLFSATFSLLALYMPQRHYGKLAGFALSLMGVVSTTQYLLFALVEDGLNGDPFWLDIAFLIMSFALFIYPYKMYRMVRSKSPDQPKEEYL